MKALFAAALCCACMAQAITLNVNFLQDGSKYDLMMSSSDGSSGLFSINGVGVANNEHAVHTIGSLLPTAPFGIVFGDNLATFTVGGVIVASTTFNASREAATSVPEGGTTAALLMIALAGFVVHQSKRSREASAAVVQLRPLARR